MPNSLFAVRIQPQARAGAAEESRASIEAAGGQFAPGTLLRQNRDRLWPNPGLCGMNEIELTFEAPLARIRLNVPARRNAISRSMWRALPEICGEIEARTDALIVVVEGAGGHFSAGADIAEFHEVYRDALATRDYLDSIQDGLGALAALDRPTIARISGVAVGGGLAVALCCDLRFCAEDAFLAITPAKLGLLYGYIETQRLVELVGSGRAKDLLFSGRRVPPAEALAIGLVNRLVPAAALESVVNDYAGELTQLSQQSIRGAKRAVNAIARGLSEENPTFRAAMEDAALGEDFREGRAAFAAKRAPVFTFRGATEAVD
jgi:enoyl-CoA hydratase/carnithine racemase